MEPATLLPLLLAAVAAAAPKRPPAPVVHETSEVSLVEVPVNVVGTDGHPIRGLTAADFELDDEGHPQQITALDVVDLKRNRLANDLPESLPEAARRHFLFLFDLSFATPNEIVHSREAALSFIEREMGPEDRAGIATQSVEVGPRLLVNFTADRKQLAAAIKTLGLPNMQDHARDPLGFAFVVPGDPYLKDIVAPGETTSAEKTSAASQADSISLTKTYANMARKTSDQYAESRLSRHFDEMGGLANALDAVEGTKRIIYFSEGFDGRLIFGSLSRTEEDTIGDNDAMTRGGFWALDVDKRYVNSPLERELRQTMDLFRRSDCVVYSVDIARLHADGDAAMGEQTDGKETLFLFSHETGGELIQNGNDLVGALRRVGEQTSVTYVLSFRPTLQLGDGKFHTLRVRVRHKHARVSARSGYYEARGFHSLTPLERSLAAADVINAGVSRGDIPVRTLAVVFPDEHIARVPILVQVPGDRLPTRDAGGRLDLGVYVYVTDEQGTLADYFSKNLSFDLAKQGDQLASGDFRYYQVCHLLPGKYRVRTYVQEQKSGRFGFTTTALVVPEPGEDRLRALPPMFVSDSARGVNLREPVPAGTTEDAGDPFEVQGVPFVPRVVPALSAGGEAKVCLMVYRPGASPDAPFAIDAEIVDATGRSRGPARVSLIGRSNPDRDGLQRLLLDFSAGTLPPGEYSLRITIRDRGGPSLLMSSSEAQFTVS